jgi:hypothetical protein
MWNSLPKQVIETKTVNTFKSQLNNLFSFLSKCSMCTQLRFCVRVATRLEINRFAMHLIRLLLISNVHMKWEILTWFTWFRGLLSGLISPLDPWFLPPVGGWEFYLQTFSISGSMFNWLLKVLTAWLKLSKSLITSIKYNLSTFSL